MNDEAFLTGYFSAFTEAVNRPGIFKKLGELRDTLIAVSRNRGKVILAGNGASASIASHFALDLTKQARIRSISFSDPALLTAFGNDYGYDLWVAKAIEFYADPGDTALLISSSGASLNMINAADAAREKGCAIVTLTGFDENNPLKARGDLNLWLESRAYNIVETVHSF